MVVILHMICTLKEGVTLPTALRDQAMSLLSHSREQKVGDAQPRLPNSKPALSLCRAGLQLPSLSKNVMQD
jgi:hypothetical protein